MALIICPECKHEVSDGASKCPHCGRRLKSEFRKALAGGVLCISGFIVVAVIVAIIAGGLSPHTGIRAASFDDAAARYQELDRKQFPSTEEAVEKWRLVCWCAVKRGTLSETDYEQGFHRKYDPKHW